MAGLVIRRKLRLPLLPPGHLRRPQLLEVLQTGTDMRKRLTLVQGSPGFGKSTLVADYAGWVGLPVVWYNLSDSDGDLLVFLEHLVEGLKGRFPDLTQEPTGLLRAAPQPILVVDTAIGLLCEELAAKGRGAFLLVLDDFHSIEDSPGIKEATDALIRYLPDEAQLVLITRTQPELNLPQLKVRQQMVELGPPQLKFERGEIARLFRDQAGLSLVGEELDVVASQTEGWIASVLLAIRAGLPLRPAELSEQLEDYLFQEVYGRQDPEVQRFLARAALLPLIDNAGCTEVLGIEDPRRMITVLWDRNLFVTLMATPDGTAAYQLHPIFRSFLAERARTDLDPAEIAAIHRKLGDRLLDEAPVLAMEHFMACGDPALVLVKLDGLGWKLLRGQFVETLARILGQLPADLAASATANLLAGEVARARGDFDLALEHYAKAKELASGVSDDRTMGLALALSAAALGARGDSRLEEMAQKALVVLPDQEHFGRAMARNALGVRYLFNDQTDGALLQFAKARELYQSAGDLAGQARVLHNMALAQVRLGRFGQAIAHYRDSIRLMERAGRWALPMTHNNLALLAGYRGEFDRGLEEAGKALDLARHLSSRRDEIYALWTFGELHLRRGLGREAGDYFDQARDAAIGLGDRGQEAMALAGRASVELEEGRADRALATLRLSLELRDPRPDDPTLGDLLYPLAKAHLAAGQGDEAIKLLEPARAYLFARDYRFRLAQVLFLLAAATGEEATLQSARAICNEFGYEYLLERETSAGAAPCDALPAAAINIQSFGQFLVEVDGREVASRDWKGVKTRLILAYLLSNRRGATKEELADLFYSDQDTTRSAIHVLISRLRQALEPGLDKSQISRFVRFVGGRYVFNFEIAHRWDVSDFDYLALRSRDEGLPLPDRLAALRSAVALYTGAYLAEFQAEPWCQIASERYRRKVEEAFDFLLGQAEEGTDPEALLDVAEQNLAIDSVSERAHQAKMTALFRLGRRDAALRHFQTMEQIMKRELGAEPSEDTMALQKRILAGQA